MKKLTPTRWLDTPNELRVRVRRTLKLYGTPKREFYHEDTAKEQQFLAITTSDDGTIDVGINLYKLAELLERLDNDRV